MCTYPFVLNEFQVVPLPHARSEVWSYFGFQADDDGIIVDRTKAICRLCASTFCYSGNTTNFYSHLKSMHSEVKLRAFSKMNRINMKRNYSGIAEDDDESFSIDSGNQTSHSVSNGNPTVSYSNPLTSLDYDDPLPERSLNDDNIIYFDDITQCIIDFLITDCRPLCVAQGRGFQRLLRLLAPGYVLPDRQKLSNALRKRYDDLRRERDPSTVTSSSLSATERFNNLIN